MKRSLAAATLGTLLVSCGGRSELLTPDQLPSGPEGGSLDATSPLPDAGFNDAGTSDTATPEAATGDATTPPADATPEADTAQEAGVLDASTDADAGMAADSAVDASSVGCPDPLFGPNGFEQILEPPAPFPWTSRGMVVQPDGKILIAGFPTSQRTASVVVARYAVDGSLDTTFGIAGVATVTPPTGQDWPAAIARQADGKILVSIMGSVGTGPPYVSYLARLSTDGALDTSFGTAGFTAPMQGVRLWTIDPRPDGTIVGVGDQDNATLDAYLTRFTSAGIVDTSFGTGGSTVTAVGFAAIPQFVAFQSDGRMVVAGSAHATSGAPEEPMLARYTADGVLDTTFGVGGFTLPNDTPGYYFVDGMVLQSTGDIVLSVGGTDGAPIGYVLQRFTADGALDTTFGTSGTTTTPFSTGNSFPANMGIALLPGDALSVGGTLLGPGNQEDIALARYTADGALDTTFATNGMTIASFPGEQQNAVVSVVLGPQGVVIDGIGTLAPDAGQPRVLDLGRFDCP